MKEIAGFTCRLVRQKRKSLRLTVSANGRINVYAPKRAPMSQITEFVNSHRKFLLANVPKQIQKHNLGIFGEDSENPFVPYLGKKLPVIFSPDPDIKPAMTEEHLLLPDGLCADDYRKIITELYRPLTKAYVSRRLPEISAEVGISYQKLRIAATVSRWGSCSSRGTLSFSVYLIAAPEKCIDHVIRHELAHRKEMNHSGKFYEVLAAMEPDHRELKAELSGNYGKWMRKMKLTSKEQRKLSSFSLRTPKT